MISANGRATPRLRQLKTPDAFKTTATITKTIATPTMIKLFLVLCFVPGRIRGERHFGQ
jgi:hypothetical protein